MHSFTVSDALLQVMINEAKQDLENLQLDMAELEDLRVMKGDIQRQEKANAELIQSQAKRLEELETLYKEEQARCSNCSCNRQLPLSSCRHHRRSRQVVPMQVNAQAHRGNGFVLG